MQEYNTNSNIIINSIEQKPPKKKLFKLPKIQTIDKYGNLFKGIHLYQDTTESLIYLIKDLDFLIHHTLITGFPPKNNISRFKKIIAIQPHDIRLILSLFNMNLNLDLAIYKTLFPQYFKPYHTQQTHPPPNPKQPHPSKSIFNILFNTQPIKKILRVI
jgi:hypothetical protein